MQSPIDAPNMNGRSNMDLTIRTQTDKGAERRHRSLCSEGDVVDICFGVDAEFVFFITIKLVNAQECSTNVGEVVTNPFSNTIVTGVSSNSNCVSCHEAVYIKNTNR